MKQGERAGKGPLGHKVIPKESQLRSFKARVAWLWRKPTDGGPPGQSKRMSLGVCFLAQVGRFYDFPLEASFFLRNQVREGFGSGELPTLRPSPQPSQAGAEDKCQK